MSITQKPSRIVLVDSLRGFALAGVALVHFSQRYFSVSAPDGYMHGVDSWPDKLVQVIIYMFFAGKFYAIFSLLFGLSFAIMMQSAEKRNEDFSLRFFWRAVLLFAIGYGHHLFYGGDILAIYAVLAPFLIPFYKINNKWLLITTGVIFIGLPKYLLYLITNGANLFDVPSIGDSESPLSQEIFNTLQNGSLWDVFRTNIVYGMKVQFNFQITSGRFFQTYGYFLLGLFLGKTGLFRNVENFIPHIRKTMKWSAISIGIILLVTIISFPFIPQPIEFSSPWVQKFGMNMYSLINFFMAVWICGGFVLIYQKSNWQKRLSFFAPYGRMALTNYVSQAVVGTFLLYGYGLGLGSQIRTLYLFLFAIVFVVIQTYASKIWLNYFNNGPLEWLWRCGTYLKIQPLVRKNKEPEPVPVEK